MMAVPSAALCAILALQSANAFVPHQQRRAGAQSASPSWRFIGEKTKLVAHATAQDQEAFQRSLLAAQIGNNLAKSGGVSVVEVGAVDAKKQEAFQRSLLAAQIAYAETAVKSAEMAAEVAIEEVAAEEVAIKEAVEDVVEEVLEEAAEEAEEAEEAVLLPEPEPISASIPKPVMTSPPPAPAPQRAPLPATEFTVPRELSLVPINDASVQFTAGLLGATAGLLLGGPFLAAFFAATTNYIARKDDDLPPRDAATSTSAKKIVDTASQTALLAYNYLATFEKDNKLVDKSLRLMEKVVDKAKESEAAGPAIAVVEGALGGAAKKVEELNDDYDFVGGAGTVLNSVADLVEISVDKIAELNEEYSFTDRIGNTLKGTLDKLGGEKDKK